MKKVGKILKVFPLVFILGKDNKESKKQIIHLKSEENSEEFSVTIYDDLIVSSQLMVGNILQIEIDENKDNTDILPVELVANKIHLVKDKTKASSLHVSKIDPNTLAEWRKQSDDLNAEFPS